MFAAPAWGFLAVLIVVIASGAADVFPPKFCLSAPLLRFC
nr:MAG TPA: hypothetical protein [Caudoviricetes sp.]